MRFHLRSFLIFVAVVGVCVAILVSRLNHANRVAQTAYAQWWAADMVINHLRENPEHWPSGWEDLSDDYDTCVSRSGQPWTFDEIKSRVLIDWEVDLKTFFNEANNGNVAKVIQAKDKSSSHWKGREPNKMVFQYLKSEKSEAESNGTKRAE